MLNLVGALWGAFQAVLTVDSQGSSTVGFGPISWHALVSAIMQPQGSCMGVYLVAANKHIFWIDVYMYIHVYIYICVCKRDIRYAYTCMYTTVHLLLPQHPLPKLRLRDRGQAG